MTLAAGSWWEAILNFFAAPLANAAWGDWIGFWLHDIFDDRYLVIYCLPLLLPLAFLRGDRLRAGAVIAGLVFIAYVFGLAFLAVWLAMVLFFYWFTEFFAREIKRTDVWHWGPPIGAMVLVGGWFLVSYGLQLIKLAGHQNDWLWTQTPWLYPLGTRPFTWEPYWGVPGIPTEVKPTQFFLAVFWNPHNIGTAYFTIRMLHYLSEIKRGAIPAENRSLLRFASFTCYGPTLMQGPIERYNDFHDALDHAHLRRTWSNVQYGLLRIAWGVAKSLISRLYFFPVLYYQTGLGGDNRYYLDPASIDSTFLLWFGVYLQIFALYLEFSGYCDVAIGMSRLIGYRVVENFNWPWLATSLRDFWRRWHISLSLILRDYVYIPLGGNRTRATFNLVVTFVLCGLWHVPFWNMGAWGLLMGLMLAVNQRWVAWMKAIDARPGSPLHRIRHAWLRLRPLPQLTAWFITINTFVLSLLLFFGGLGGIRVAAELFRRLLALAGPYSY